MTPTKAVWVTKYALTTGILERECEISGSMATYRHNRMSQHFHGKDWHLDYESARIRAEEMRIAKIASLRKQIAKLEQLKF